VSRWACRRDRFRTRERSCGPVHMPWRPVRVASASGRCKWPVQSGRCKCPGEGTSRHAVLTGYTANVFIIDSNFALRTRRGETVGYGRELQAAVDQERPPQANYDDRLGPVRSLPAPNGPRQAGDHIPLVILCPNFASWGLRRDGTEV
jgi:hypothetical protein